MDINSSFCYLSDVSDGWSFFTDDCTDHLIRHKYSVEADIEVA